jgi:NAD(P)H-dependent FMN reductase
MGQNLKILAFWASSRKNSCNKMLIQIATKFLKGLAFGINEIDLKDYPLPFYDPNIKETDEFPINVKKIRNMIISSDVWLIAAPEYNYSMPAILKNLIDWASRSEKNEATRDAFRNKKVILMSASGGPDGGAYLLNHLKEVMQIVGCNVISNKIAIPSSHTAFNNEGNLIDKTLNKLVESELSKLLDAENLKSIGKQV